MTKRWTRRSILTAGGAAWLSACATSPGSQAVTRNGFPVDALVRGEGSPAVVLVHGLGDDRQTWRKILDSVSAQTQTVALNRPGYGNSRGDGGPRDADTVSEELRASLAALGVPAPFLLVGHSLGGVYTLAFAQRFPDLTAGLVLVDTTVPGQTKRLREAAPLKYGAISMLMLEESAPVQREFSDAETAEAQVSARPTWRAGPVIFLEAGRTDPLLPKDVAAYRASGMRALAQASGGELRTVGSGHFIQRDKPDAVVTAIHDALTAVRRT